MNWTEEQLAEYMARLRGGETVTITEEAPEPDVPEAFIEAECTKILEEDGWRALRTDPVSDRSRGKGFGEPGMADHCYFRYAGEARDVLGYPKAHTVETRSKAEVAWIEFKRTGEKAKKHQTSWHLRERARGALTLIAGEDFPATVEGFRKWYATSGLQRRSTRP